MDQVVVPMKKLLAEGVKLAVISGTTINNIGGGKLHEYFTPKERQNLFYGLGRGAITIILRMTDGPKSSAVLSRIKN